MNVQPIQPIDDRIVVKILDGEETTAGGLVLPSQVAANREKFSGHIRAVVRAVGPGRRLRSGARATIPLAPGDVILVGTFGDVREQRRVELDGEELLSITEEHVLCALEETCTESKGGT